jgi:multidrug efflux pump subunit AcrA (membrane-fusion protein)
VDEHDHDHEDEQNDLRLSERQVQPVAYLGQIDGLEIPAESEPKFLIVEQLNASKGQGVKAGEMLSSLSDYSTLYIEGKAFEQDAPAIAEVAGRGWPIEAVISTASGEETLPALQLTYVANVVDPQSRTLSFFVNLPNSIIRDETNQEGQRFITWKYRAGQRLDVRVPVELWEQQIVLPVDAAVKDGADWFVFQQNGDHFDRIPVHVVHRDQQSLVIANDGAIFPGDIVARRSAHQMQMALKNKSGTGADPHAGHNH